MTVEGERGAFPGRGLSQETQEGSGRSSPGREGSECNQRKIRNIGSEQGNSSKAGHEGLQRSRGLSHEAARKPAESRKMNHKAGKERWGKGGEISRA